MQLEFGEKHMYDKKECGDRLKRLRKAKGKTQEEVAKEIGVSVDTICKVEQGKRSPSIAVVELLKCYYNTTADYIISGYVEEGKTENMLLNSLPEQKRDVAERLLEDIKELLN